MPFEEIAIIGPSKLQKIYDNKFANIGLSTIANRLHEDGIPYNLRYALTKKDETKAMNDIIKDHVNILTLHGCKGLEF